jgi:hypothetical protein
VSPTAVLVKSTCPVFCERVKTSRPTAYAWKRKQFGPPMVKVGSRQFFRHSEVTTFIAGLSSGVASPSMSQTKPSNVRSKIRVSSAVAA